MYTALTISNTPDRTLRLRFEETTTATATATTTTPAALLPPLREGEVRLKALAAPINPIDPLVIAGRYPVKPKHTFAGESVLGFDGVFRVLESRALPPPPPPSSSSSHTPPPPSSSPPSSSSHTPPPPPPSLVEGDLVIPRDHGFGTWRTHAVADARALLRVPRTLDPLAGAILKMGACPAYLLLEDMPAARAGAGAGAAGAGAGAGAGAKAGAASAGAAAGAGAALKPGDWIIQNGATSVVAQLVIQYARLRGVHTVSVVRDRPDFARVKARLEGLGGDVVISESELRSGGGGGGACKALEGKAFVLGLDCVFGASGEAIARVLAPNGTYVNFGLLGGVGGGEAISVTSEMIFFKAITFRSFRLSQCLASRSDEQVAALLAKLGDLFASGQVKLPALDIVRWCAVDDAEGAGRLEKTLVDAVRRAQRNELGSKKVVFSFAGQL